MKAQIFSGHLLAFFLLPFLVRGQAPELALTTDKTRPVLKTGETILFRAEFSPKPENWTGTIRETLHVDGKVTETREITGTGPITRSFTATRPGWAFWRLALLNADGTPVRNTYNQPATFSYGVIVDPFAIRPARSRPADFDKRWAEEIAEMRKVPMDVQYIPSKKAVSPQYNIREVHVPMGPDCLPVTGWLYLPADAKPGTLPISLNLPGANFFPLKDTPSPHCSGTAISFEFNPHGLPIQDCDQAFYMKTVGRAPNGYYNDPWVPDFKKCYYRNVFLRVVRAIDFLKSLPEWDGKNINVQGASQGGGLSIVAAALHPEVTRVTVNVPAFCDHGALDVGRAPGWPQIMAKQAYTPEERLKMLETADYFDSANFAPLIKAPITVCTGLIDEICPSSSVFAAYNAIPAATPSRITVSPFGGHGFPGGVKKQDCYTLRDTLTPVVQ